MASQDNFIRTALRVPPDLHAKIHDAAADVGRTFNAEINARLEASFTGEDLNKLRRDLASKELEAMQERNKSIVYTLVLSQIADVVAPGSFGDEQSLVEATLRALRGKQKALVKELTETMMRDMQAAKSTFESNLKQGAIQMPTPANDPEAPAMSSAGSAEQTDNASPNLKPKRMVMRRQLKK